MTNPDPGRVEALSDRYRIERELGQGGMATVYLAQDLKHDRQVAIKVLRPELGSVLGAERFLQEIRLTARLRHPHILPLYDSGTVDGTLFYVTPLVEGGSLKDRLARDGRLPVAEAIRIAREVADALAYAHQHDVIHRDIKPDNILLESGHATVADFGIARAISAAGVNRLTEAGIAVGTPAYMSPEQAGGDATIDRRADIYALGTVLYEMLAGEPPFTGPTLQAMMAAVLTRAPAPLPIGGALSPALATAVSRAMAKSPSERFDTAVEFGEALRLAEPEADIRAGTRRSRRTSLAVAALAVLSLIAVMAWMLGHRAQTAGKPLATRLAQVTSNEAVEEWPAWSPDGKQIVFSRTVSGYRNLFVKQYPSGEERQLTHGSRDDIQAAWSPDGTTIALVRSTLQNGKLEPGDVLGWYAEGGDVWTITPGVRQRDATALGRVQSELVAGRCAPRGGCRPWWRASYLGHRCQRAECSTGHQRQFRGRGAHVAALVTRRHASRLPPNRAAEIRYRRRGYRHRCHTVGDP